MARVRLALLAVMLCVIAGLCLPVRLPTPQSDRLGLTSAIPLTQFDDAALTREVLRLRQSGVGWFRLEISWPLVEPQPGVWDFSGIDRVVNALRAQDINVLGLLLWPPTWALPSQNFWPSDEFDAYLPKLADFARTAAAHLGDRVDAWEVWNEPNLPVFFPPQPHVQNYVRILKTAYVAIKSIRPTTTVLAAGLADPGNDPPYVSADSFLEQMYEWGAHGYFDAIALHPYTFPSTVDANPRAWADIDVIRGRMVNAGDGDKRIWLTEFGAPTGDGDMAVSATVQARILASALTDSRHVAYLGPIFLYCLRDSGTNVTDREENFGLLRNDGSPKPAWTVLRDAVESDAGEG